MASGPLPFPTKLTIDHFYAKMVNNLIIAGKHQDNKEMAWFLECRTKSKEELEKMKFGARIIKPARTAFNRQVCESVQIQENAARHEILNSKSEYNRCALPRLGEVTVDKLEKMKNEEKPTYYPLNSKSLWAIMQLKKYCNYKFKRTNHIKYN